MKCSCWLLWSMCIYINCLFADVLWSQRRLAIKHLKLFTLRYASLTPMNIDNFLRLHATSGCGGSLYRPCGTMSLPGTQSSPSIGDACGIASSTTCSVAAAIDSIAIAAAAGGSVTSFHHGVMHGSGIMPRPPPSSPGGLPGTNMLHRHGYVGHHMTSSGVMLPHHSSTGPPVHGPHHLLTAPFVAAAHSGQMNALTLAERLAGVYLWRSIYTHTANRNL